MRALTAEVTDLRAAIGVLESRCVLRPGEVAAPGEVVGGPRRQSRRPMRGYGSAGQRFSKTRAPGYTADAAGGGRGGPGGGTPFYHRGR